LERELKKKGIKLLFDTIVEKVEGRHDGIHIFLSGDRELVCAKVLVSVGRSLNSEGIGLDTVGIERGPKGQILTDEKTETNIKGVYAIGDVTGKMLLAHVASQEGIVAAYNACGIEKRMDYRVVPAGIFTSPEIGSVGIRENQAAEKGIPVKTGHFLYRALGKAHAMGEIAGMFKVISDAATDKVLGVHIIGAHASDLVHEGALAIHAGLTAKEVAEMIHAHPTLSEGMREACEDVHGEAIHSLKK
ncbi:MAG TPA: FAD-dependent oxidoreductase, partial [Dissulfurispiraceae bacterium]